MSEINFSEITIDGRPLRVIKMPSKPTTARWFCKCGKEHRLMIKYVGQEIKWAWPCVYPIMEEIDLITIGG